MDIINLSKARNSDGVSIMEPSEKKILKECYDTIYLIRERIMNVNDERFIELYEVEEQLTCALTDLYFVI
jgi:hypothetical protein